MIYVTHDQVEAMTLVDRIVILDSGKIIQVGKPRDLYENPLNLFVAQFIGSPKMNIVPYEGSFKININRIKRQKMGKVQKVAKCVGVRPEHINIVAKGEGHLDAIVDVSEYLGSDTFLVVNAGTYGSIVARCAGDTKIPNGIEVGLYFNSEKIHFFDDDGRIL